MSTRGNVDKEVHTFLTSVVPHANLAYKVRFLHSWKIPCISSRSPDGELWHSYILCKLEYRACARPCPMPTSSSFPIDFIWSMAAAVVVVIERWRGSLYSIGTA
jgi:hypothetical protein